MTGPPEVAGSATQPTPASPAGPAAAPRWWRRYVTDVVTATEADSAAYQRATPPARSAQRTALVLVVSAVCLTLISFLGRGRDADWLVTGLEWAGLDSLAGDLARHLSSDGNPAFSRLMLWAGVSVVGYVVLPVLAVRLVLRERLRDFGLRVSGVARSWKPYAALFAVALPFILLASLAGEFQARYPFYDLAPAEAWWPYLWLWWAAYALQFAALEFFFRGFMVHGLKQRLGIGAVFVMVVPYTMIHFGKPLPEALAAILGGTILGFLSLKTGAIWWGVALHIAVAGSMDLLALAHQSL